LDIVEKYDTYEDYLGSQLTATDLEYLDDEEVARQLVELGYRGLGDTIRREDFEARKQMFLEKTSQKHTIPKQLASVDRDFSEYPFLQALASREELLRTGKLTTILFLRDFNNKVRIYLIGNRRELVIKFYSRDKRCLVISTSPTE
jgi:hypothetical protein